MTRPTPSVSRAAILAVGAVLIAFGVAGAPQHASAQLNNKPFSFNTPDGGVGMSTAGRQAMILDQVYNIRPDNLLRDPQGNLGTVEQGPGGSVVFRNSGGTVLPGFKGSSWRGPGDFAGSFNAFFVPGTGSGLPYYRYSTSAADTIGGWTSQLDDRGRYFGGTATPIDSWTAMVGMLARRETMTQ